MVASSHHFFKTNYLEKTMADPIMARTEFAAALNQISTERGIEPRAVLDSLKQALIAAFRKDYPNEYEQATQNEQEPTVKLAQDTGEFKIFLENSETGEKKDITPPGFGRIAAQTAKQVIMQQVREAEKTSIIDEYRDRLGELITGQILRLDGKFVVVDIGRGQGLMPPEEQIKGEFYKINSRMAVVVADIRETYKGESVIVSRSDPRLVRELFAREVPEVGSEVVVIEKIARQPGTRTKIAVKSTQDGVDPVGSCVGQKGVRVQAVINELNGERIDIIQYSKDPKEFISSALSPAEDISIDIDEEEKTAQVTVPEDQLSLAIGRGGQNVKLAAKLTGYKLKIESGTKSTAQVSGDEEHEIDLLDLKTRVRNQLVDAGILMIDQHLGENIERLKEIDGIGPKSIQEIEEKLAAYQASQPDEVSEEDSAKDTDSTEVPSQESEETPEKAADQSAASSSENDSPDDN